MVLNTQAETKKFRKNFFIEPALVDFDNRNIKVLIVNDLTFRV